jgi:hypothetical protein
MDEGEEFINFELRQPFQFSNNLRIKAPLLNNSLGTLIEQKQPKGISLIEQHINHVAKQIQSIYAKKAIVPQAIINLECIPDFNVLQLGAYVMFPVSSRMKFN